MYDRAIRVLTQPTTGTPTSVGPGSYYPPTKMFIKKNDSYAPFLSLSLRESFLTIPECVAKIPGPGNYNPKILTSIKGGSTLHNKALRFSDMYDGFPGPGSYDLISDWLCKKTQCFSKQYEKNSQSTGNCLVLSHKQEPPSIPSPGQANGYEDVNGSLHKQEAVNHDVTLGPAFYKINYEETAAVKKYRGIHFGKMTSRRPDFKGTDGPGPGNYDPYENKFKPLADSISEEKAKPTESKLPRYHEIITLIEKKKGVPGPGQYELKSQFENVRINEKTVLRPSFGSKAKRFIESKENLPAPGSYDDPRHAFESCSRLKGLNNSPFGQTATRFPKEHHINLTPGPGAYSYENMSAMLKRKALLASIKKGGFGSTVEREFPLKRKEEHLMPGPAHYLPKSSQKCFSHKNHAVFKSTTPRLQSVAKEGTPPHVSNEFGKLYDNTHDKILEKHFKKNSCGFLSSAERFNDAILMTADLDTPGPGHYDIKKPSVTGGNLVTKEERFKSVICDVPGPGTYQLSPLLRHTLMKSTFNATLTNPVTNLFEETTISKSSTPALSISVSN